MKITKAEWDQFWGALGCDWYMDDSDVSPEDDSGLAPGDAITFSCGAIGWQGKGNPKPNAIVQARDILDGGRTIDLSLPAAVKRWRKAQTVAVLSFEIPKDKVGEVQTVIAALGGKQIGGQG